MQCQRELLIVLLLKHLIKCIIQDDFDERVMLAHMLSKEGRRRIIEVLVSERGGSNAAEALGISRAALSKFLNGKTHPSDALIEKAIEIASIEEKEKIVAIVAEDLLAFARDFFSLLEDLEEAKNPELLQEVLHELEKAGEELKSILEKA
jgi:transcriptional regulator with XRE-family HTH domain